MTLREGKLSGKTAIVTGAERGIGRGVAIALAAEGARVVVASLTASLLDQVVGEIRTGGGLALGIQCDVSNRGNVFSMVERAVEAFGPVDVLVNNAQGYGTSVAPAPAPLQIALEECNEQEWEYTFRTGLWATLWSMKAVFPHMKERGGKIINFGSSGGQTGAKLIAAYNANKEAIRGLSRTAAREWGKYGINVNVINPSIKTETMDSWFAGHPDELQAVLASLPLGRFGTPADLGKVVVFLSTSDSDFITGMTLMVDSGGFMSA
jgi:2-hydroxycyclohexanecarboxyl-CoA dehydrogenase